MVSVLFIIIVFFPDCTLLEGDNTKILYFYFYLDNYNHYSFIYLFIPRRKEKPFLARRNSPFPFFIDSRLQIAAKSVAKVDLFSLFC